MVKTGIVKSRVLRNTHFSVKCPMEIAMAEGEITHIYLTVNFTFLRQQFHCLLFGCSIAAFGPTLRRWENRSEMCPTILYIYVSSCSELTLSFLNTCMYNTNTNCIFSRIHGSTFFDPKSLSQR